MKNIFFTFAALVAVGLLPACSGVGVDMQIGDGTEKRPTITSEEGINFGYVHRDNRKVIDTSWNLGAEDPLVLREDDEETVHPDAQVAANAAAQAAANKKAEAEEKLAAGRNITMATTLNGRSAETRYFDGGMDITDKQ